MACLTYVLLHALEAWLKWKRVEEDLWEVLGSSPIRDKNLPIQKKKKKKLISCFILLLLPEEQYVTCRPSFFCVERMD